VPPISKGFVRVEEATRRMEIESEEVLALDRSGYLLAQWNRGHPSDQAGCAVSAPARSQPECRTRDLDHLVVEIWASSMKAVATGGSRRFE
jgi:hypothetical protein